MLGRLQVLTHRTPEHLWQSRYIARDNAITGLCEAVLAVPDPEASAERLTRFTGRGGRLGLARSGPDPRLPARTRGTPPGRRARAPDRRPARRHGRGARRRAGKERLAGSPKTLKLAGSPSAATRLHVRDAPVGKAGRGSFGHGQHGGGPDRCARNRARARRVPLRFLRCIRAKK